MEIPTTWGFVGSQLLKEAQRRLARDSSFIPKKYLEQRSAAVEQVQKQVFQLTHDARSVFLFGT
ncbi:unnamed protein product, partial [Symbiodinium natans]